MDTTPDDDPLPGQATFDDLERELAAERAAPPGPGWTFAGVTDAGDPLWVAPPGTPVP